MNQYFVDANIFLRFVLQDDHKLGEKAKDWFAKAKAKKIKLIFIPEIIFEIDYVLKKVYHLSKKELIKQLFGLIKTFYLDIIEREIFLKAMTVYSKINVDLVDIYLLLRAKNEKANVISFDRDFKKIEKALG